MWKLLIGLVAALALTVGAGGLASVARADNPHCNPGGQVKLPSGGNGVDAHDFGGCH